MDIRIKQGEEIRVTAEAPDGNKHTTYISYDQVLTMGERLIDGLTEDEIAALKDNKKIMAIRSYRLRAGCALKDAKLIIENWIEKHRCCRQYPYCEHEEVVCGLDLNELKCKSVGGLSLVWSYPAVLTEAQAQSLQNKTTYKVEDVGFFSFQAHTEQNETRWASNREQYDENCN